MRNDCDNIFESTIDEKCYKTGYSYKEESNGWRKRTEWSCEDQKE